LEEIELEDLQMLGGESEMMDRSMRGGRRTKKRSSKQDQGCFGRCIDIMTGRRTNEVSQEEHQREWD